MKYALVFMAMFTQIAFANASVDVKALKKGENTMEALGDVTDANVYTSLRVIKCVESKDALPEKGILVESAPSLQNALFLTPGSSITLRRAAFSKSYTDAMKMSEFVRITCE